MMPKFLKFSLIALLVAGCSASTKKQETDFVSNGIKIAEQQIEYQITKIDKTGKILNPRTLINNNIQYVSFADWTSGFFPGSLWYLYDLTKDEKWKVEAERFTMHIDSAKYLKSTHDVGFIINCSFGNGYRLTNNPDYKATMIRAAKSLITRFRPKTGTIQSWNVNSGWQSERGWMCPVIADNMMNLELLFEATKLSGDSSFWKIAVSHADKTLENHFRQDFSCYHVVDYDTITGEVRNKITAQGYSNESSWARGQAWALYGFTVCYRETQNPKYLDIAEKIAHFIITNKNMPADMVPYWDFDAPNIPNEPRDASAAAINASALYELSTYGQPELAKTADKIMTALSGPAYLATPGTNHNFVLMHSVGSIPHNNEIDVPLNYADYYFLEALARKKALLK